MLELSLLCFVLIVFITLYWRLVGINLSATSVFFGAIWLIYGVGYIIFSRLFGPGRLDSIFLLNEGRGSLSSPNFEENLTYFLTCAREIGQYGFILQTSINRNIIGTMDLALCLMFAGLIFGCYVSDKVFANTPQKLRSAMSVWSHKTSALAQFEPNWKILFFLISALSILLYFAIKDQQLIKVIDYFASDAGEFEKIKMRQAAGGSKSYFFNLMLATVLPFICFYLVAFGNMKRCTVLLGTLLFVGLVFLAKLALLSKAPVVVLLVQIFLVINLRKTIYIGMRTLLPSLAAFCLLMFMVFTANPDLEGLESLSFLVYRLVMAPNEALLEYFASIPHFIDYTLGRDNRFFTYLLNEIPLEATYFRVSELYRGVKGYSTNTMLVGDAWAQFSWFGVAIIPFVAGFIFRSIDIQIIGVFKKSPASIAGLGLAYYAAFTAMSTSFQTSLLTGGLILVLPLIWAFSLLTERTHEATIS